MAISNFIPTIWSETLFNELSKNFIAVDHCNRDFEGEIKGKGSTVNICGVGPVSVRDYTKNTDLTTPEEIDDNLTTLTIEKARFFNFLIDDVDKAQSSPKLMEGAMVRAAEAMANDADRYVFSLYDQANTTITCDVDSSLYDAIISAREALYENNVGDNTEVFLEVHPKVASKILREKLAMPGANDDSLTTGYLGSIFGCKIYVSNNIYSTDESDKTAYHCFLRTKRAITFADQISEVEAYRPEKRFADGVKGLHLYGAKVIYPKEMVCLDVKVSSAS